MDSPIGVPKTGPDLGIFNKNDLVFFPSKVFSRAYRHFGGEKIEKKHFPKKWMGLDGSPYFQIYSAFY